MVITMAKLRMAHASTHGARKPPGPKKRKERLNNGDNNGQATHGARKPPGPKERLNNGDNNGQATHGARKHAWRIQAAWANFCIGNK